MHGGAVDVSRVRPLRVLSRRPQEVLCVVNESVEWIDVEAVDEEKIITSEETPDATAPVIYDVSEWIDAGNLFVEDDWDEKLMWIKEKDFWFWKLSSCCNMFLHKFFLLDNIFSLVVIYIYGAFQVKSDSLKIFFLICFIFYYVNVPFQQHDSVNFQIFSATGYRDIEY